MTNAAENSAECFCNSRPRLRPITREDSSDKADQAVKGGFDALDGWLKSGVIETS